MGKVLSNERNIEFIKFYNDKACIWLPQDVIRVVVVILLFTHIEFASAKWWLLPHGIFIGLAICLGSLLAGLACLGYRTEEYTFGYRRAGCCRMCWIYVSTALVCPFLIPPAAICFSVLCAVVILCTLTLTNVLLVWAASRNAEKRFFTCSWLGSSRSPHEYWEVMKRHDYYEMLIHWVLALSKDAETIKKRVIVSNYYIMSLFSNEISYKRDGWQSQLTNFIAQTHNVNELNSISWKDIRENCPYSCWGSYIQQDVKCCVMPVVYFFLIWQPLMISGMLIWYFNGIGNGTRCIAFLYLLLEIFCFAMHVKKAKLSFYAYHMLPYVAIHGSWQTFNNVPFERCFESQWEMRSDLEIL